MASAGPNVVLVVTFRGRSSRFELTPGKPVTVGRTDVCTVRIDDKLVSRRHAEFRISEHGLEVLDLGSHNGTLLMTSAESPIIDTVTAAPKETRLAPREPYPLTSDSVVQVGGALITVEGPGRKRAPTHHDAKELVLDSAMVRLYELAERIAGSDLSVLILGESGVGKDVLARFIHRRSTRSAHELVSINCGAFAESLLEAELFGYEKGAFTGAAKATKGLLEAADSSTLFFDEVGELTPAFQVKLLRVLESQQFMRVGGRETISVNVRFIAATNRDLGARVAAGAFREDLFYRLNGISLTIPSLRERACEVLPLAERFLREHSDGLPYSLTDEAKAKLQSYPWPGNVRQLKNVVRRAAVLSVGNTIGPEHIQLPVVAPNIEATPITQPAMIEPVPTYPGPPEAAPTYPGPPPAYPGAPASSPDVLRAQAESLERQQIIDALEACAGNQTRAAEMLGLTRRSLVTRLNKYNIPRPRKGRSKD